MYGRLLSLISSEIAAGALSWELVRARGGLRFGQAGPLRLVGTAHRMALAGSVPDWAALLPSCGGVVPDDDRELLAAWRGLAERHGEELVDGLDREVQTNEVARGAGLALALAEARMDSAQLVELGCSGGLNLRLDRFEVDLGGMVLGDAGSRVHLHPRITGDLGGLRHVGLTLPRVTARVGIDVNPVDPTTGEGQLTLLGYVWPDQTQRLERMRAAMDLAVSEPAELLAASVDGPGDTAELLAGVLAREGATVVSHSIVWQYVPTDVRWRITEAIEEAGSQATDVAPLAWIRYEPDEWNRNRAAVWLRRWPDGGDRLVAHVDYHGRWLSPA